MQRHNKTIRRRSGLPFSFFSFISLHFPSLLSYTLRFPPSSKQRAESLSSNRSLTSAVMSLISTFHRLPRPLSLPYLDRKPLHHLRL